MKKSFFHYCKCGLKLICDPQYRFCYLVHFGLFDKWNDEFFLQRLYRAKINKELNLKSPETFNEKLQWLKINERRDVFTTMVDKYAVKQFVAKRIGEEHVVPTLGVWDDVDSIDWESLPNRFVMKCNHDGGPIICRDKRSLDIASVCKQLKKRMSINAYRYGREWPYKNVKRKILAEELLVEQLKSPEETHSQSIIVYKFLTFHSEPRIIQVIQNDKRSDESIDYFDADWNLLNLRQNYPNSEFHLPRPKKLEEMLDFARKLSQGTKFVRVDFYEVNEQVYFSEFTFYSDGGMASFYPEEWDAKLGSWINL